VFTPRPEHLESFNYVGVRRYFLTFCTHNRLRPFVAADRVEIVRQQILRSAAYERMAVLAYCFMPDHLHVLVEGESEDSDCLRFIKRAKQLTGFHYNRDFGERLWQRYGFEHVLRNDEATLSIARYIVENPIRAGLVNRVDEYPFVGSERYPIGAILEAVQMNETWSA